MFSIIHDRKDIRRLNTLNKDLYQPLKTFKTDEKQILKLL